MFAKSVFILAILNRLLGGGHMSSHYQTATNYIFSTRAGFARFLFCFGFLMLNPTLVYNTEREKNCKRLRS